MKKLILIGLIAIGAMGLTSCEPDIVGNNVVEREFRRTAYFDEIELNIPAEVILRQGTAKDIEIEAEDNVLSVLDTRISNNTLRITYNGNWVRTNYKVKIWIQVPDIEAIRVSGSGKVISDNTIIGKNLELRMSGSGLIDVAAEVKNEVAASVSGSGLIYVEGAAYSSDFDISGSGKIEGFDLKVDDSFLNITGSGRCETTAFRRLDVSISGSGDGYFRGRPTVKSRISGSGHLFDAN
jgi:hypothetical protein